MRKIKIAILLVAVMAMLPVFPVTTAAATENEVTYVALPPKDTDYSKNPGDAPQLIIASKHDETSSAIFKLKLSTGTKWTFKEAANLSTLANYFSPSSDKSFISDASLTASGLEYTLTQISNTEIQVVMNDAMKKDDYIRIPLIVKINGIAEASVTISGGETFGITGGTYVFANAGSVNKAELEISANAKLDGSVITGDITIGMSACLGNETFEFSLPKGYVFAESYKKDITYEGSGSYEGSKISNITTNSAKNTLYVKLADAALSTLPGRLVFKNVKVNVLEDAPNGEVTIRFGGYETKNTAFAFGANKLIAETPTEEKPEAVAETEEKPESGTLTIKASATSGSTTVVVNGEAMEMPAAPYNDENGRMMVPLRFIANAFGVGQDNVTWEEPSKTATVVFATPTSKNVVSFQIGSDTYTVDGVQKPMDTAAVIKDGLTFVPVKYVAEAFGITVNYNSETKTAEFTGNFEW